MNSRRSNLGSPEDAAKELIMNLAERIWSSAENGKHTVLRQSGSVFSESRSMLIASIALSLICVIAAVIVSVSVFAGLFLRRLRWRELR